MGLASIFNKKSLPFFSFDILIPISVSKEYSFIINIKIKRSISGYDSWGLANCIEDYCDEKGITKSYLINNILLSELKSKDISSYGSLFLSLDGHDKILKELEEGLKKYLYTSNLDTFIRNILSLSLLGKRKVSPKKLQTELDKLDTNKLINKKILKILRVNGIKDYDHLAKECGVYNKIKGKIMRKIEEVLETKDNFSKYIIQKIKKEVKYER